MRHEPFDPKRQLSRPIRADRTAPGAARRAVDELNGYIDPAVKDSIRLLVSEVVTNSVIHAQPETPGVVVLDVWVTDELVRVAVTDRGPGFEAPSPPQPNERSGWGLMMVDQLADRWGVELDDGTEVWFEFQQPDAAASDDSRPGALCLQ